MFKVVSYGKKVYHKWLQQRRWVMGAISERSLRILSASLWMLSIDYLWSEKGESEKKSFFLFRMKLWNYFSF
jgi:hypothetical protein